MKRQKLLMLGKSLELILAKPRIPPRTHSRWVGDVETLLVLRRAINGMEVKSPKLGIGLLVAGALSAGVTVKRKPEKSC